MTQDADSDRDGVATSVKTWRSGSFDKARVRTVAVGRGVS
jgi:hypothetical protein